MLRLALAFLIVALLAGLFGFGLVEGVALQGAQILFFLFLVLAVIVFLANAVGGRDTAIPT
jgi:uncharacterized membrane protein YtjA (UPF0391 family)